MNIYAKKVRQLQDHDSMLCLQDCSWTAVKSRIPKPTFFQFVRIRSAFVTLHHYIVMYESQVRCSSATALLITCVLPVSYIPCRKDWRHLCMLHRMVMTMWSQFYYSTIATQTFRMRYTFRSQLFHMLTSQVLSVRNWPFIHHSNPWVNTIHQSEPAERGFKSPCACPLTNE